MTCDKCQRVLDNWQNQYFASPRKFHDKICALEASAKAGCLLGGLILSCYMKRDLQRVRAERKEDSVLISARDLAVLSTEFSDCCSVHTWAGNFASETCVMLHLLRAQASRLLPSCYVVSPRNYPLENTSWSSLARHDNRQNAAKLMPLQPWSLLLVWLR